MYALYAIMAAFLNMLASVFQRRVAKDAPAQSHMTLGLFSYLAKKPLWLLGIACMIGAFLLQAAALGAGPLALVQPLLTSSLLWLLAALKIWFHLPIGRREWLGGLAIVAGLSGFVFLAQPGPGRIRGSALGWAITLAVVAVTTALTIPLIPRRSRKFKAAVLGALSGVSFSLTAALTKTTVDLLTHGGAAAAFASWQPYMLALFGITALFLMQNSYHAGPLSYSQPAITAVDPLCSILVGVFLFQEHLRGGTWAILGDMAAVAVLVGGIILLAGSKVVLQDRSLSYLDLPPEVP